MDKKGAYQDLSKRSVLAWRNEMSLRVLRIIFASMCLAALWLGSVMWVRVWQDPTGAMPLWQSGDIPPPIPGLRAAPWVGSWPPIDLCGLSDTEDPLAPVALMLHIFSTPKKASRERRELLRELSPLLALPERYRHLVEIKFVLGHPPINATREQMLHDYDDENSFLHEQDLYGDLLRLEGLHDGDNLDRGKTWEWIRHLGHDSPREALWVVKGDDDTLPFLQHLLPWLLTLDPAQPTYFGSLYPMAEFDNHSAIGPLYGFSWNVIKTIAAAQVETKDIQEWYWEDQRTAMVMNSLPNQPPDASVPSSEPILDVQPGRPRRKCHKPKSKRARQAAHLRELVFMIDPPAVAAPSGVKWIDLPHFIDQWFHPCARSAKSSFAWHGFKSAKSYRLAYKTAKKELKAAGLGWKWIPPKELEWLASAKSD